MKSVLLILFFIISSTHAQDNSDLSSLIRSMEGGGGHSGHAHIRIIQPVGMNSQNDMEEVGSIIGFLSMFSDIMNIMDALESSDKGFLSHDNVGNVQTIQESGINPDGSHFFRTRIIISQGGGQEGQDGKQPTPGIERFNSVGPSGRVESFEERMKREIEDKIAEINAEEEKKKNDESDPFASFNTPKDENEEKGDDSDSDGELIVTRIEKKDENKEENKGAEEKKPDPADNNIDISKQTLEQSINQANSKPKKKSNRGAKLVVILVIFSVLSLLAIKLIGRWNPVTPHEVNHKPVMSTGINLVNIIENNPEGLKKQNVSSPDPTKTD